MLCLVLFGLYAPPFFHFFSSRIYMNCWLVRYLFAIFAILMAWMKFFEGSQDCLEQKV